MKSTVLFFLLFTLFVSSNTLADEFPTLKLLHNQWTMISLPATPPESSNTLEAILGDDFIEAGGEYGTDWSVSSYVAESKAYETLSLTDTMEKGRGYWIIQKIEDEKPVTLDMPIDSTVTAVTESIPLTASSDGADLWNLVGNPFTASLNLAELRLVTDAPSCSDGSCDLNKAKENNLVGNNVFIYDGKSYKEKGTNDQLDPWNGFWVAALGGSNGYSLALAKNGNDEGPEITYIGSYDTLGDARSVALSDGGSKAYVAERDNGLQIIDISNPAVPTLLGSFDTPGEAQSVTLSSDGRRAYVADPGIGSRLEIIDISNPIAPTLLGSFGTLGNPQSIALSSDGSRAYVAEGFRLQIVDISNPAVPTLLGSYETSKYVTGVTLSSDGNRAYLATSGGLQIVDISKSEAPTFIGSYDTRFGVREVSLSNDSSKVYLAVGGDENSGLQIVDISNSLAPTLLGSYDTPGSAQYVTLSSDGSKAYVADVNTYGHHGVISVDGAGLMIFDISNPAAPILLASYDTPDTSPPPLDIRSVTLSSDGSKAYLASSDAGLQIVDISKVH